MSLTNVKLSKLQNLGRIVKKSDLEKEANIRQQQYDSPEYPKIRAGREEVGAPMPKKQQVQTLAELAQVIKQSRQTQYDLSQARGLLEQKQTEFFEKQAKPVVKAVEENAPEDNVEELKEVKSRLLKAGMPLDRILSIEPILKSIVESVSRDDSENDKYLMLNEYYPLVKSHSSVVGFESVFENVMNEFYGISSQDLKFEKWKKEADVLFSELKVKLNESEARALLKEESDLDSERIEKLLKHLKSKNLLDVPTPVVPKVEVKPEAKPEPVEEKKDEIPKPEPIMASEIEKEIISEIVSNWKSIVFSGKGRKITRRNAVEDKIETWLKVQKGITRKEDVNKLLYEITSQIQDDSVYKNLQPPKKSEKQSILRRFRGLGLNYWMAGKGNPFGKPIPVGVRAPTFQDFMTKSNDALRKQMTGKGLNISNMNPSQLMNTLALNIASQKAGNTGVSDIINSTIDEMLRRQIISKAEHKRLWYELCDH